MRKFETTTVFSETDARLDQGDVFVGGAEIRNVCDQLYQILMDLSVRTSFSHKEVSPLYETVDGANLKGVVIKGVPDPDTDIGIGVETLPDRRIFALSKWEYNEGSSDIIPSEIPTELLPCVREVIYISERPNMNFAGAEMTTIENSPLPDTKSLDGAVHTVSDNEMDKFNLTVENYNRFSLYSLHKVNQLLMHLQ